LQHVALAQVPQPNTLEWYVSPLLRRAVPFRRRSKRDAVPAKIGQRDRKRLVKAIIDIQSRRLERDTEVRAYATLQLVPVSERICDVVESVLLEAVDPEDVLRRRAD